MTGETHIHLHIFFKMEVDTLNNRKALLGMILPGFIIMIVLYVIPLIILIRFSFYEHVPGQFMKSAWSFESYKLFISNPFYRKVLFDSLWLAAKVVFYTILLGYPVAYLLARKKFKFQSIISAIVVVPLLTSPVVMVFGWMVILAENGIINETLINFGILTEPLRLMFNETGVVIALVQSYIPFMILSIRSSLNSIDYDLEDAASTLGSPPLITFFRVIFPLSVPGIFAGSLLVFILTISAFVTPILIGGGRIQTLASLIYTETMVSLNWPLAGASSILILVVTVILLGLYRRLMESKLLGGGGR